MQEAPLSFPVSAPEHPHWPKKSPQTPAKPAALPIPHNGIAPASSARHGNDGGRRRAEPRGSSSGSPVLFLAAATPRREQEQLGELSSHRSVSSGASSGLGNEGFGVQAQAGWRGAARKGGIPWECHPGETPGGSTDLWPGMEHSEDGPGRTRAGRRRGNGFTAGKAPGEHGRSPREALGRSGAAPGRFACVPPGARGPAAPSPPPYLPLQRDLVALQVLPAGALLQQLCPQLVDLGTRTQPRWFCHVLRHCVCLARDRGHRSGHGPRFFP